MYHPNTANSAPLKPKKLTKKITNCFSAPPDVCGAGTVELAFQKK